MPRLGSTSLGPLAIREGGLQLWDALQARPRRFSEERHARITLTAAQLATMGTLGTNATFDFAPAPGANRFYEVLSVIFYYVFNTTAFSASAGSLVIHNSGTINLATVGFVDQTSSQLRVVVPGTSVDYTSRLNQPLRLTMAGSPSSVQGGNGSLLVVASYRLQDLNP